MATQVDLPLSAAQVLSLLPPYPVVLVTTRTNIITINQVQYFTFTPLRMGIAIAATRYSYSLLKAEGEFVINVPGVALLEAVKLCGSVSGRTVDKFDRTGLTPEPSSQVAAVGLAECGAQIEVRVERELAFEERTWFIGPVVAARRSVDHSGMAALTCGRSAYALPGAVVAPR